MIKVDRGNVEIPNCLRTDIDSIGKRETEDALKFFAARITARTKADAEVEDLLDESSGDPAPKKEKAKSFPFQAYRSGDVKPKLKALFNGKCGFCEIDYGGAAFDIEHFRPKGGIDFEVDGENQTYPDGYYWLAADWGNLIYSCQHCNRCENHDQVIQAGSAKRRMVSGKGNYFPLSDESMRLQFGDPISKEEPYRDLLNPCVDNPRDHLEFREDGLVFAKMVGGRPSRMGVASIKYYGLRRDPLVERRKTHARNLQRAIIDLDNSLVMFRAQPESRESRSDVIAKLSHIRAEYLAPNRPFLGMCRHIFLRRVDVVRIKDELNR
ncbi:hypothetical protein [Burkholderia sp. LMG 32019]|uniref:hypothetical protein n=1 Tax=Burkholderia sp. LMG 32019 TaxID=3158173 RepID=UPI003C2C6614